MAQSAESGKPIVRAECARRASSRTAKHHPGGKPARGAHVASDSVRRRGPLESCCSRDFLHNDRPDPSSTVPLSGLSASQRSLVERHSPLVHLTLNRTFGTRPDFPPERADMVQEGYLALAEAIRTHDPARHGVFASYAMARIHFAMSRYRHEYGPLIRVPFVTQRRRRDASRRAADNGLHPAKGAVRLESSTDDALPRVVPLNFPDDAPHPIHRRRTKRETPHANGDFLTIGDLIRQRIELALEQAVAMESQRPRRSNADRELIRRCAAERLGVPNEASRTPLRRLAAEIGCPLVRVTRCEAALGRTAARLLERDAALQVLLCIGREADEGWRAGAERITIEKPPPARSAPGGDGEPAPPPPAPPHPGR